MLPAGRPASRVCAVYYQVWATDGTLSGTRIAFDIKPGSDGSFGRSLHSINGNLFFFAKMPGDYKDRLFVSSDGTLVSRVAIQTTSRTRRPRVNISNEMLTTVADHQMALTMLDKCRRTVSKHLRRHDRRLGTINNVNLQQLVCTMVFCIRVPG